MGVCIYGREGVRCGCLYIWQRGGEVWVFVYMAERGCGVNV